MSFDKDYPNRKDKRKPYYKSKRVDRSCRCHGGCEWCMGNRLHKFRKKELVTEDELIIDQDSK